MAKKLKEFANFSGKKYKRHDSRYGTKEDAIKKAKDLRKKGFRVIRDKSGEGHFLWVHKASWTEKPKPKVKPKPKPKTKPKATSTRFKGGIHHRNRSDAQSEMISWKKKGYSAEIRQARIAGELTYRVYKKPKAESISGSKKSKEISDLIKEHNKLSREFKKSKERQEEKIRRHKIGPSTTYTTIRVKEFLDEQGHIQYKKKNIQEKLKKLGYKQEGL